MEGWYDCSAEGGRERGEGGDGLSEVRQIRVSGRRTRGGLSTGADLFVMFVYEPNEVFLTESRPADVGGKRPERGWLVESGRCEKRGQELGGVKREIEKLEEGRRVSGRK